jgi:uncharacterized protein (TIGR02145 family)
MKKIYFVLVCLLLAAPLLSAEKKVVLYMNDGAKKIYNLSDIESMELKNNSIDNLMQIYSQSQDVSYYPVNAIDSIRFNQTLNASDSMMVYIYGAPRKFSVNDLDSISFRRLETKLKADVFVFDSLKSKDIISIDSTSLVMKSNSPIISNLTIGKIITSEPTTVAPYGFLRRVVSITSGNNGTVVVTENAKITDVVESGIVSFKRQFSPSDTLKNVIDTKTEKIQGGGGFTLSFAGIVIYDNDKNLETTNDQISLDGTNTFTPTIGFNLVIDNWQLKQVLLQLNVENQMELTASANFAYEKEIQKSLNELLGIPKIKLPNITIWLGWFPFVITSQIDVQVGCSLSIGAEVSTGISTDATASAGVEYNSGRMTPISKFTSEFTFNPPELSLGGSVKGFVGPQINVNFYNVPEAFNANAGVFGFLELNVSLLSKPLWQLWAGVEATAGVQSEWFGLDYTLPLVLELRKLLAQANDLVDGISPNQGKIGDIITITGTGFGDSRGSNYVAFKRSNSLANAIQAIDYPEWTDEEIQVRVPSGLSAGSGQLMLNLGGYLSNTIDFKVITAPVISSINPKIASEDELVIITGSNFGGTRLNSVVTFNGINATTYDGWTSTTIKVRVPKTASTGKVSVTANGLISNEVDFTVKPPNIVNADTVIIGTQVWMTKNLDVEKYRNGEIIPQVQDQNQWRTLKTGAWCYYSNDSTKGKVYGKLYNWYAVKDPRGLAPEGWHVPSDTEWKTMETYLGGTTVAGGKLKETGFNHWSNPNTSATNSSGFIGLPGGTRNSNNGSFIGLGTFSYLWTSTESSSTNAIYKGLSYTSGQITTSNNSKVSGYSVRCIKD